jgi:hypothetical protein
MEECAARIRIGSKVIVNGETSGVVRYIGPVHFKVQMGHVHLFTKMTRLFVVSGTVCRSVDE